MANTLQTNLYTAFASLKDEHEAKRFLYDLLTPEELAEFSKRFAIATKLWKKEGSYAAIAQDIKTSTTTVTRVARFLWKESHKGYQLVLERLVGKTK
jgi:TrpR-related protein YerC/YecD